MMRGSALAAVLFVSGCGEQNAPLDNRAAVIAPTEILADCWNWARNYPEWAVELADANAEMFRRLGGVQLRPGHMVRQPRALAIVKEALRPLDVVFLHSDNRVSGLLIPGKFTHGAVYLGTEDQLRAAGLWYLPEVSPWRQEIAAGAVYLEAVDGVVRLASHDTILDTDAVVVLRPLGMDRSRALSRGLERIGVPFDMRFDATDPSALFCAELISLMFPDAELPYTRVPGRETIMIDAIVAGAVSGHLPFGLVGYVEATAGGGARVLSKSELASDVRQEWQKTVQTN